ncbi:ROK family protein [Microbacterium aerolatum]|uniref:ROK family transcriptional regulator n=1 Tax=Microbacterium aerolatum TaxID=153731 RepID=UPI00384E5891
MVRDTGAVRAPRKNTRGIVLDVIRTRGPISRIELAEATGLTAATMTRVVRDLLADGLVVESGHGASTGGKRPILVEIDPTARFAVGIHIAAESTVLIVSNLWGAIVGRSRAAAPAETPPDEFLDGLATSLRDLLDSLGIDPALVAGVGVAAPGTPDRDLGRSSSASAGPRWEGYPLREGLAQRLGLRIVLENEAIAAAVGEYWSGAAGEIGELAVIHMETDIGVGVVTRGRPLRGAHGGAGDLGHLSLDVNGAPCPCGGRGCLHLIASPAAARERYRCSTGEVVSMSRLGAAAVAGERDALEALNPSFAALAQAAGALVTLLDVERIVLAGSGFASAISFYISAVQQELDRRSKARGVAPVAVQSSVNPRDAAAVGAAAVVLHADVLDSASG